ncbi:hypothetical protein SKAU_G00178710 [Synaphobranchus kaupii]|uniref:Uncharacterized protein n=1 Tax=Synaphobranchus kaupii TaxID=118154 RepID=A0A9Q1FM16_SYNKA|nr:hypothetical protein SKAU_G00178710 [Synaphobranchus kaupii]
MNSGPCDDAEVDGCSRQTPRQNPADSLTTATAPLPLPPACRCHRNKPFTATSNNNNYRKTTTAVRYWSLRFVMVTQVIGIYRDVKGGLFSAAGELCEKQTLVEADADVKREPGRVALPPCTVRRKAHFHRSVDRSGGVRVRAWAVLSKARIAL